MYTTEKIEDKIVIRINKAKAEIEINNVQELKSLLKELIGKGEKKVLIDFKNVVYIDSSGLGVLLDAMKDLKEKGGELGILSISKDVLEVFTATKIAQFFKFYKTA